MDKRWRELLNICNLIGSPQKRRKNCHFGPFGPNRPPPSPFLPCFWGQKTDFRFFLLLCHLPPFYGLSFWHHVQNISPNSQKKSYRRLSKTFRFWFVQDSLGENKITHWVLLDWISPLSPFYYRQQALSLSSSKRNFQEEGQGSCRGNETVSQSSKFLSRL